MNKLSTGMDATFKNYRLLAVAFFGEKSPAVKYLDEQIERAGEGENAEVIADEGQVVHLLIGIHLGKIEPPDHAFEQLFQT